MTEKSRLTGSKRRWRYPDPIKIEAVVIAALMLAQFVVWLSGWW